MRIYYIANSRIPTEKAHGIQIMKMCEAFASSYLPPLERGGVDLELIIPRRRNKIKDDAFEYYKVEKNFKITKLPTLDLVDIIPRLGFWIQSFSFAKFVVLYFLFRQKGHLRQSASPDSRSGDNQRVSANDFIYSRDEISLWFLSFFKKNLYWESHRGQYSFFAKRVAKKAKGIIVITQGLKDFYVAKGVAEDKILVAPDGVDLDQFHIPDTKYEIRQQLNLPQDKFIVAYTGHLYDWKGAHVLLEAAKQFPISLPSGDLPQGDNFQFPINFVFVGGTDSDIAEFKREASGLSNILILGHKPHNEIPMYLKAADVLVLPTSSKSDIGRIYTSPMKMFEYMAAGRPIVASDLPSIREVLNENNSVLVTSDSSKDLAEGIRQVLKNPEKSAKITEQARKDAGRYTWENRARNILAMMI